MGYDQTGCIVLSYRDSADGKIKSEALDPLELIRRWLLNVPQRPHAGASSRMAKFRRAERVPSRALPARTRSVSHPRPDCERTAALPALQGDLSTVEGSSTRTR